MNLNNFKIYYKQKNIYICKRYRSTWKKDLILEDKTNRAKALATHVNF